MSDLIDATEMYLRTIYELTEEGVRPMRARIAERLGQSGPTVSQTVARMQRDGLVEIDAQDRHLVLTAQGSALAMRVMRKHRLAECLLVDVIGLPWEEVHAEACRWEHVMSESVERRLLDLLNHPVSSPFGNPIPGLAELEGEPGGDAAVRALPGRDAAAVVRELPSGEARRFKVLRIGEILQSDEAVMAQLREVGGLPGSWIELAADEQGVRVCSPVDPALAPLILGPGLAGQLVVS